MRKFDTWGSIQYNLFRGEAIRNYTIILEPDFDEGGYTVTVPALPSCITQGETVEQCIERAQEAFSRINFII